MYDHRTFIELVRELGELQIIVSLSGKIEDLGILYPVVLQRRSEWEVTPKFYNVSEQLDPGIWPTLTFETFVITPLYLPLGLSQ